jgi:tetratricopeptide (TPR) repeat protein
VAATIALVLVLAGGRDGSPRQSAHQRTSAKTASRTSTTAAVAPQPPPPPAAPKNVGTGGETPAALNDRGHRLLQQGQYGEAVAPLRAAVQGYKAAGETGLPYAFALYNLAVALNRSGNPGEAIPLLRERLQFDNQRQTVQAELDNALSKVGGTAPAAGSAPNAKGKHLGKQKGKRD